MTTAAAVALMGCAGVTLMGCAAGTGAAGSPGFGARHRADEWITIRDFRHVLSVAVSERSAYFGTTAGLERWDTLRETWDAPLTEADGLPDDRVTALAVEDLGGDVWIGTRAGLVRLAGFDDVVESVFGPPPAHVDAILIDPRDGTTYARVAGLWWAGRGASFERVAGLLRTGLDGSVDVGSLDPSRVPWFDPLYARGGAFRGVYRLTQADRDLRGDWYAGTWGDNGRRWRVGAGDWETLAFGLAGRAGGPLARASDGLWLLPAGDARDAPAALAHARGELEEWSYVVPREHPELPSAAARAAIALGDTLLLGNEYGLAWGEGPEWRGAGRDDDVGRVAALAADGPVVWVGSDDGLAVWDRSEARVAGRGDPVRRVTAFAIAPDAVFVGSEDGLWVARRSGPTADAVDAVALLDSLAPVSLARAEPRSRTVVGMALHGHLLLVATEAGLDVFDRETGAWRSFPLGEGRLHSAPLAVASDGVQVWLGTRDGLVRWRPDTDEWRAYGTADGLAGAPVLHLLAEPDAVWASTPEGATRFAWRSAP